LLTSIYEAIIFQIADYFPGNPQSSGKKMPNRHEAEVLGSGSRQFVADSSAEGTKIMAVVSVKEKSAE
jgi:hypothetical protein